MPGQPIGFLLLGIFVNKSFKNIWCEKTGTFIAVAETAKSRGKKTGSSRRLAIAVLAAAATAVASADALDGGTIETGGLANGTNSVAIGSGSNIVKEAPDSIAIGKDAKVIGNQDNKGVIDGDGGTAIGASTRVGHNATAIGYQTQATGVNSTVLGNQVTTSASGSIAIQGNSGLKEAIDKESTDGIAIGTSSAVRNSKRATAFGKDAVVSGSDDALAWGTGAAIASDSARAIAIGAGANINTASRGAVAIGDSTFSQGHGSISLGEKAQAGLRTSGGTTVGGHIAIGLGAVAGTAVPVPNSDIPTGATGIAVGAGAHAGQGVAIGLNAKTYTNGSNSVAEGVAIGNNSSTGAFSVAIGGKAKAGMLAASLGDGADAAGQDSAALGAYANASAEKSIAIGKFAKAQHANSVALGADAATAAAVGTSSIMLNGKRYDFQGTSPAGTVSVGKAGSERTVTNVAAGRISSVSTDAINGSQLHTTNQALESITSSQTHYYSVNDAGTPGGNYNNDGATGAKSVAAGVGAVAANAEATAIGSGAVVNFSHTTTDGTTHYADRAVAIGSGSKGRGADAIAIGTGAVAGGAQSYGLGDRAIAIGQNSAANGSDGMALGSGSKSSKRGAVAIGSGAEASGESSTVFGNNAKGLSIGSIAVGNSATAGGNTAIAVGLGSSASAYKTTAIGADAEATESSALALGNGAKALNQDTVAVGKGAVVSATRGAAMGTGATVTGDHALALGSASASAANSVALGARAVANRDGMNGRAELFSKTAVASTMGAVSVGSAGSERQITNVAGGTQDTDAVNIRQLKASNQQIVNVIGGTTNIDASTGEVKGPFITLNGNTYNTVGDAITNVNTIANKGWHISAQGENSTNVVPGAAVDLNNSDGNIVVSKKTDSNDVSFDLADDLTIGNSVTTTNVNTTNLTVTGDTRLGDNFSIINNEAYYSGPVEENFHVANKQYVDNSVTTLAGKPLSFAGNTGSVDKKLGETMKIQGMGADGTFSGTNLKTEVDENGVMQLQMAESPKFGKVTINHDGTGKITGVTAGTADTDAVNVSQLNAVEGVAKAGWHLSAQGANETNVAPDDKVDLNNSDGNIVVSKKDNSNDVTFDLAKDINVTTVTMGGTVLNQGGLTILNGPSITTGGINAGDMKITNVAEGSAPTDAVNVSQLERAVKQGNPDAVVYDDSSHTTVTLNKGGPSTTITNVAKGDISENSTDAVNGSQLWETNQRVNDIDQRVTNIDNTVSNINNGGGIRYFRHNVSDDSMPDASANGQASVAVGSGATTTEAATSGVAMGMNAKVDAANGIALGSGSSVTVANSVALGAGSVAKAAATPVSNATVGNMTYSGFAGSAPTGVVSVGAQGGERQVTNVAAGRVTADSTDAVNGSQLYSVADGLNKKIDNSVSYDVTNVDGSQKAGDIHNDITLKGDGGTQIHNVADGEAPNDAATVGQLDRAVGTMNQQMQGLSERIETVNKDANAGTAGAMAMAGMPQATLPGKSMVAAGVAAYQGEAAIAMGVSKLSDDSRWIVKLNGTANTRGKVGVAGGVGFHW